jgi:predicted Zn finger-like uncharacterized protein
MDGTTLCPHCDTRFKIGGAQLEAHQGLVRCGQCLQTFDARVNFISDIQHPQLELPMLDMTVHEPVESDAHGSQSEVPENVVTTEGHHNSLDFSIPVPAIEPSEEKTQNIWDADDREMTLAEQVEVVADEASYSPRKNRTWLWGLSSGVMLLVLLGQAAYFFRADIAARLPVMKPALVKYCELLGCKVSLPQKNDLMSIESSSLEADPNNAAQITLNALLRNRATYPLAFPNLELTLNDRQDKPVARRVIKPADYLPPSETEQTGLLANHELNLKLPLDTTDLNPNGYRLVVFYPAVH